MVNFFNNYHVVSFSWFLFIFRVIVVRKCRPRGPRGPDERAVVVDRVPALEAAIRGFTGRVTEVVVNPTLGTVFDSLAEAYEFYNLYSWEVGFGIRYGKSMQNVNGTKCMQEIVCGCAVSPFFSFSVLCWVRMWDFVMCKGTEVVVKFYDLKTNAG